MNMILQYYITLVICVECIFCPCMFGCEQCIQSLCCHILSLGACFEFILMHIEVYSVTVTLKIADCEALYTFTQF